MKNNAEWYEVGTHTVDITPPLTVPYLAGDPRHSYFTGVHDPLFACATVISDGVGEAVLIGVDGIGFCNRLLGPDRDFVDELKSRIEQTVGIPKDAIMLLSNHIHSTPDTINFRPLREVPGALNWLELLCAQICQAAATASNNRFRARLKQGTGLTSGLIVNRRLEEDLDNEIGVLLFESLDDDKQVMLIQYACHPVIVQVQELVSADFIGAMRRTLQNELSNLEGCLFIQGACGDINPAVGASKKFEDVEAFGKALAKSVMEIYRTIQTPDYRIQPVKLRFASYRMLLASRALPEPVEGEAALDEEALWRIREGDAPYAAELQLVRLGDCVFVGIPGEPMSRMGLRIKEMFKPLIAYTAGYANGYVGYLASIEDWNKGGYEVSLGPWSKVGYESYEEMIRVLESMNKQWSGRSRQEGVGERDGR